MSLLRLSSPLPSDHRRIEIPSGLPGTAATIGYMKKAVRQDREKFRRGLVEHGKRDFRIRQVLGKIIEDCDQKDYYCYAKAVHDFVKFKIKYVHDPVDVELVESPWHILQSGIADCDSKCGLEGAFYECMGMPYQFVTVKGIPGSNEFSHVYGRVKVPGRGWIATDTTMPNKPFGWEPKGLPEKTWDMTPMEEENETNMNALICDSGMSGGVVDMQQEIIPLSGNPVYLGEMSGATEEATISGVVDGSTYRALRAAKDRSNDLAVKVGSILNAANQITNSDERAKAMAQYTRAQAAVTAERTALQNAIEKYNELARLIQTYSNQTYKPQLMGLGNPIIVLAGIAVVATAALAFQVAMSAYQNNSGNAVNIVAEGLRYVASSKGIDVQAVGLDPMALFQSSSKLQSSIGLYAMIGGGLILGVLLIKKMKAF